MSSTDFPCILVGKRKGSGAAVILIGTPQEKSGNFIYSAKTHSCLPTHTVSLLRVFSMNFLNSFIASFLDDMFLIYIAYNSYWKSKCLLNIIQLIQLVLSRTVLKVTSENKILKLSRNKAIQRNHD